MRGTDLVCPSCKREFRCPNVDPDNPAAFLRRLEERDAATYEASPPEQRLTLDMLLRNPLLVTCNAVTLPRFETIATYPLIASRRVVGVHVGKEFLMGMRDLVGGRSGAAEKTFEQLETDVLADLSELARGRRCHAVLAVRVDLGVIETGTGTSMFYGRASGTPARLRQLATPG